MKQNYQQTSRQPHYAIRKTVLGVGSVVVGMVLASLSGQVVHAEQTDIPPTTSDSTETHLIVDNTTSTDDSHTAFFAATDAVPETEMTLETVQPVSADTETDIEAHGPLPTKAQLDYHKEELAAFIHFGMNTFTNKEWGNGKERAERFNPTELDADQWISVLKETGFKRTIMVVKHHDGFVLYPSEHTEHDVAASPWKEGKGDVLLEVSNAASKHDMNLGVYLSPWDANHPTYKVATEDKYNEYYLNQLKEILGNPKYGNKGKFVEVWMDGARGSGAEAVTYTFDKWFKYIREQEGDITIFSAEPTSVRWIGNERGIAGDPVWHKVKPEKIRDASHSYLNNGDPDGTMYSVGEADVSIRPGWFYHENQQPKSLRELMDIYFQSVGRGTPLLLNIPPDTRGKFADADVARLREFHATIQEMYANNLAKNAKVTATSTRGHHLYKLEHLTDGNDDSVWAPARDAKTAEVTIDLGEVKTFDVVELKEYIQKGQRISSFDIDVEVNGQWLPYGSGSTVGYRRLIQNQPISARRLRVRITGSQATPILNNIAVYKTPKSIEKTDGYPLGLTYHSNTDADRKGTQWHNESEGVRGSSQWTNQQGATVEYSFTGTKAYIVSTVDPNHSVMEVHLDGEKIAEVDTNRSPRKRSQMVYETPDLKPGKHTLTLVNKTNRAIATEGIFVLNNDEKGMIDIAETSYDVIKGEEAIIRLRRVGGSKGEASVKIITEPGTGVHGKVYVDTTKTITFADGETEKTVSIPTIAFTERPNETFDFYVKVAEVSEGVLTGFNRDAVVNVMPADSHPSTASHIDDRDPKLDYHHNWNRGAGDSHYLGTESWTRFKDQASDEDKQNVGVTIYFKGTGIKVLGTTDQGHGVYDVVLDGLPIDYKDGLGHATIIDNKAYFSGKSNLRTGNQTLVHLRGLEDGLHSLTIRLSPDKNDLSGNVAIQLDKFDILGKDNRLLSKEELLTEISERYHKLLEDKETLSEEQQANLTGELELLDSLIKAEDKNIGELLSTLNELTKIITAEKEANEAAKEETTDEHKSDDDDKHTETDKADNNEATTDTSSETTGDKGEETHNIAKHLQGKELIATEKPAEDKVETAPLSTSTQTSQKAHEESSLPKTGDSALNILAYLGASLMAPLGIFPKKNKKDE